MIQWGDYEPDQIGQELSLFIDDLNKRAFNIKEARERPMEILGYLPTGEVFYFRYSNLQAHLRLAIAPNEEESEELIRLIQEKPFYSKTELFKDPLYLASSSLDRARDILRYYLESYFSGQERLF